jgi:hypothetical protein
VCMCVCWVQGGGADGWLDACRRGSVRCHIAVVSNM